MREQADGIAVRFMQDVRSNPVNSAILERWSSLNLADGWLVAGCLFQTIWNLRGKRPPTEHIRDYDIFYFDAADLSEAAEQQVQAHVDRVLGDLGVVVEAKNQARVHLWYRDHFGHDYPRLRDARDGIDRFLVPCTCVGVRPVEGAWEIYAPHGLPLLYEGVLSPNPLTDHRDLFMAKAASYRQRWPWLRVEGGVTAASRAAAASPPFRVPSISAAD